MGNNSTPSNKSSTTNAGGSQPQWAQVGTPQYNNMNSALQTLPMAAATQTIAQGGMGANSQQASQNLMNPGQIGQDNWQSVFNQAGQPGAAQQYLTDTAAGNYLGGSPYLEDIISAGANDVAGQVNNMFASGGRYGSVANQGALSDSVARYGNELRNTNYQAERDRQLGAANSLEQAQQGRIGLQGQAAGGIAGVQGQNINNQMQGALGAAGLENAGFQNMLGMISQLPTIQGNKMFDSQQQQAIGGQVDQRAQQQLQDRINQWTQSDNEDWARLGGLISAAQGAAGPYGTQSGTQTSTQPMNILGALGTLFTAPVTGGGSLLGNFFSSDRRLKENILRVGKRNGFALYEFDYKGKPGRWRGVMADEVEAIMPDAVRYDEEGYAFVNYGQLGIPLEAVEWQA